MHYGFGQYEQDDMFWFSIKRISVFLTNRMQAVWKIPDNKLSEDYNFTEYNSLQYQIKVPINIYIYDAIKTI